MRTQEAFTISILDCARRLGLRFNRTWINGEGLTEHVFHCPLRKDKNASIYINEAKNVWYDNGGIIDGGGIVHFVNYLHGNSLRDTRAALKILDGIYPELKHPSKNRRQNTEPKRIGETLPLFANPSATSSKIAPAGRYGIKEKRQSTVFEVVEVKELFSYPLKNYLERERKLNLNICNKYVKEVVYKHKEKNISFYGIGFKSGDTWAIRRNGFKGFLGKGVDISIFEYKGDKALVFEGFIDFLSYLTAKKVQEPFDTCIVLNSAVQVRKVLEYLDSNPSIKKIDYFRDRDEAGQQTLDWLKRELKSVTIRDMSETYSNHKDLNEWLTNEYSRTGN